MSAPAPARPATGALQPQDLYEAAYIDFSKGSYALAIDGFREFLRRYPDLAAAPIERFEALEQLRALWHGYRIAVRVTTGTPAPGVDTQEDLDRVRKLYAGHAV